jgi:hypothetical protein
LDISKYSRNFFYRNRNRNKLIDQIRAPWPWNVEMCRPRVGAANLLFSLWRALWRSTVPASRTKSRRTAEESRTNQEVDQDQCYTRVQHNFHIDPMISPCQFIFQPFVTWLRENYDYRNVSWEMICIYDLTFAACQIICIRKQQHTWYKVYSAGQTVPSTAQIRAEGNNTNKIW